MNITHPPSVPFNDLGRAHADLRDAFDEAWTDLINKAGFIGGDPVERFERKWASYCQTRHCIGVSDGTAALELALLELGVRPGDEVIVPANTFIATVEAVDAIGAVTVFADVDPDTLLLSAETFEEAITSRTTAVIPVHLHGRICPMDTINDVARRHSLIVVEDAAQAHGAQLRGLKAGSQSHAGCFSFYPGKNLGAFGDAGAIVTNDTLLADRIRSRVNHGRPANGSAQCLRLGGNHRLDALQAAILEIKLPHLDHWNASRRGIVQRYRETLDNSIAIFPNAPENSIGAAHVAAVLVPDRDRVRRRLSEARIATGIHYPIPCHRQPACAHLKTRALPVVEHAADRLLSLPLFPQMTRVETNAVIDRLSAVLSTTDPRQSEWQP